MEKEELYALVNSKDEEEGCTPLHQACFADRFVFFYFISLF